MRVIRDVEKGLDVVEEVTEQFKKGRDLDDIFYIGYSADHGQMREVGGLWAYFGWDTEEAHYEQCNAQMDILLKKLRSRPEIAEIQTEIHEEFYESPVKGGCWRIRFA